LLNFHRNKKQGFPQKQTRRGESMKKVLATLAIVAFGANAMAGEKSTGWKRADDVKRGGAALEKSYEQFPNPVKPLVGAIVSPLGNTIQYVAEGAAIVRRDLVEGAVRAVYNSGKCIADSTAMHPGYTAGCVVSLGGDLTIVILNTAGNTMGNLVEGAGEILADLAFIASRAAYDLGDAVAATGVPVVSKVAAAPFYVVGFVLDHTGRIVKVTAATVADAIYTTTGGLTMTIGNLVDVPVSLLQLNPGRALQSLGFAAGSAACTVIDLLLTPARLAVGLVAAHDKSVEQIGKCTTAAKREFRRIRSGERDDEQQAPAPWQDGRQERREEEVQAP
jgi:hypothetical protein